MNRTRKGLKLCWPFIIAFLVVLWVPTSVSTQTAIPEVLMNMPQVRIATYVSTGGNQPEISDAGVKAEVIALLRNKAPKMKISDSGSDTLVIAVELNNMTIEDAVTDNYYGVVMAWVFREARITAINKIDRVVVWHQSYTLVGSPKEAQRLVNRVLDRFMTQFAADWLLANP